MRTLIVIPTYLEAENIVDVLGRVRSAAPTADVLVVDDSSPDGTAELARGAAEELGRVDVLDRPGKSGLGVAYRAGFEHGFARGYEVIVQMDADLSHDPATLPELLGQVEGGADVVIGSRYVAGGSIPHWPFIRRVLSRIGNLYASTVLGLSVRDATSGFRAYRAELLHRVVAEATKATGYGFQVELSYRAHRMGARITEVPITFNDRVRGQSKMSWHIIGEAMSLVTWWGLRDRLAALRPGRRTTRPKPVPARPRPGPAPAARPADDAPTATDAAASGPGPGNGRDPAPRPPLAPDTEPA